MCRQFLDERVVVSREGTGLVCIIDLVHLIDVVKQCRLVACGHGDDVVKDDVAQHTGLYLHLLDVGVPFHLVAGGQLCAVHHARLLEHLHRRRRGIGIVDEWHAAFAIQAAPLRLLPPFVAVAVAVETNGLRLADILAQHFEDGVLFLLACRHTGVHLVAELLQLRGNGGVKGYHSTAAVGRGTHGAELEAVASESEGRGAVAVGIVDQHLGDMRHAELHTALFVEDYGLLLVGVLQLVEHRRELAAEEDADDGRGRLLSTQTMGVGGSHNGGLQEGVVLLDGHHHVDQKGDEAEVLLGRFARGEEADTGVGAQRPVAMLARAIHAGEGLLVQQHLESVPAGNFVHQRHKNQVLVDGQIGLIVDGRQLELIGCHLVVAGLAGDGILVGFELKLFHKRLHTGGDSAEVVVLELLVLRRLVTQQRAARQQQVGACRID